ncbi:hypothetical protein ABK040_000232 [Willaertia magna]
MNLENLTTLTINNCLSINGECFLTLKNLQDLDICYCHNIKFKYLSNLKKLINLNVRESGIKDKDLTELNNMKYLNVKYCSELVSGKFLLDMNKLTQLECFEEPLNKLKLTN